jgi:hypothetical protein
MRTDDPDNQRVKVVHQFTRRRLIVLAHPIEAASQIERQDVIIRHERMEARSCTTGKTCLAAAGYERNG